MRARSLARRWALTPPFHPYPFGRSVFCATFRGSLRAVVNGHPALMEPGLSSLLAESDRPAHSGEHRYYHRARGKAHLLFWLLKICREELLAEPSTVILIRRAAVLRRARDGSGTEGRARSFTRSERPNLEPLQTSRAGGSLAPSGGFGRGFVLVIKNSLAVGAEVDLKMFLDFVEQLRR
jgi:hypothetical protein